MRMAESGRVKVKEVSHSLDYVGDDDDDDDGGGGYDDDDDYDND